MKDEIQEKSITVFLERLQENQIEFVDCRFTDLLGIRRTLTLASSYITSDVLEQGIPFDGSSIPGWTAINTSDLILRPILDPSLSSVLLDPFAAHPTLIVFCDVITPSNIPYSRNPREVALRGEEYLKNFGFANKAFFGVEAEFFIFDSVQFEVKNYTSSYKIKGQELSHYNEKRGNLGYRPQLKGGYLATAPSDFDRDIRSEIANLLQTMTLSQIEVEKHHHEVATNQHEINFRYDTLVRTCDNLQIFKYVVRNVANRYGKTATFMPKPLAHDNGSGMHVHQSLWFGDLPIFAGDNYEGLSELALFYIGGILHHAKSLNALTNATSNSYRRLQPGFEAPVVCSYSALNRSAACRIPHGTLPSQKRVEVRFPDSSSNAYLGLTALMMAGLDGIANQIHPKEALTHDVFKEVDRDKNTMCGSLKEALCALEEDHDYLCKGDVFSKDLIAAYCELKWKEVALYNSYPHPIDFQLGYQL
jgi:glutamine synthetase